MSKWYVGVDVNKDELVVVVMGRKPKSFANTVTGSKALWRWAKTTASGATVHVCMEATGVYGYRAAMALASCSKTEASVVNPAQIAAFARAQLRQSKTDALDAQVILAFAQSQQPQPWHPQSAVMRQLYALVSQWDALAETKRRLDNRSHSHKHLPDLPPAVAKAQTSARAWHVMVSAPLGELLFGGSPQHDPSTYNDTWIYDYKSDQWNEVSPCKRSSGEGVLKR